MEFDGVVRKPHLLAVLLLRQIKDCIELQAGETISDAVIAAPTRFNEFQRQALKWAANLAGLHVKRLISEPAAAAITYGLGRASIPECFANDCYFLLHADAPNNLTNAQGDFPLQDRLTILGHPNKVELDMNRVCPVLILRHSMSSVKDNRKHRLKLFRLKAKVLNLNRLENQSRIFPWDYYPAILSRFVSLLTYDCARSSIVILTVGGRFVQAAATWLRSGDCRIVLKMAPEVLSEFWNRFGDIMVS